MRYTKEEAVGQCIAQYVRAGGKEPQGRFLLRQELRTTSVNNLADALIHDGFASAYNAPALAAALHSEE